MFLLGGTHGSATYLPAAAKFRALAPSSARHCGRKKPALRPTLRHRRASAGQAETQTGMSGSLGHARENRSWCRTLVLTHHIPEGTCRDARRCFAVVSHPCVRRLRPLAQEAPRVRSKPKKNIRMNRTRRESKSSPPRLQIKLRADADSRIPTAHAIARMSELRAPETRNPNVESDRIHHEATKTRSRSDYDHGLLVLP